MKIKTFCVRILKTLAPPHLKEIENSSRLSAKATPFTPRRVTRSSASMQVCHSDKPLKQASVAETVLLRALGISPAELSVMDEHLLSF
jgi:hypothetical protein